MILVDTSIWIDHLHQAKPVLVDLLGRYSVRCHPMVIGELALGNIKDRETVLDSLDDLPSVVVASHDEVMYLVTQRKLYGRGLSLVDAHLIASVLLDPEALLWTRDKRLRQAAADLGVGYAGDV
jgi:hypothetical protein